MDQGSSMAEEDEGGYLVAASDLMSGLLFLFILTSMVFALSYQDSEDKKREEVASIVQQEQERERQRESREHALSRAQERMLVELQEILERAGVAVTIDTRAGVLRLPEEVLFPKGRSDFLPTGQKNVEHLAHALAEVLPCYIHDGIEDEACAAKNPFGAMLSVLLIEGHADRSQYQNSRCLIAEDCNWDLSADRAMRTFNIVLQVEPDLGGLKNEEGRTILGVSGYGSSRPIDGNAATDERNRRIDLRFIMSTKLGKPEPLVHVEEELRRREEER